MNKQNLIIKEHLTQIAMAVSTLQAMGLTITGFTSEGNRPRIEIMHSTGCSSLEQCITKYLTVNGTRLTERNALMSGCIVRWIEPVMRIH